MSATFATQKLIVGGIRKIGFEIEGDARERGAPDIENPATDPLASLRDIAEDPAPELAD